MKIREWLVFAPIPPPERAMMDALAYHTKYSEKHADPLVVWPSVRTLAAMMMCSDRAAHRTLKNLRDKKYITKVGETEYGVVKYRLNLGHYHAQKIRLPSELGMTPTTPPDVDVTTPLTPVSSPPDIGDIPPLTSASYKQDVFEQDEMNGGEGNAPTPTANTAEEETGKIKTDEEKRARVVAAAKGAGFDSLHADPRLAAFYDRLGPDPDAVLGSIFADWDSYKTHACKTYGCWWWKKNPYQSPLVDDLIKDGFAAAKAAVSFHAAHVQSETKSALIAQQQAAWKAEHEAKVKAAKQREQFIESALAANADYMRMTAFCTQAKEYGGVPEGFKATQLPYFAQEHWDACQEAYGGVFLISYEPPKTLENCPAWLFTDQCVKLYEHRCAKIRKQAEAEYDAQQEAA